MTNEHFPAHQICFVSNEGKHVLLAATGSSIQSLSFPTGKQLSSWPRDDLDDSSDEEDDQQLPPGKRQKLNDSEHAVLRRQESEASEASIEIVAEGQKRQKGERRRPKIPDLTLPNVSHLIATSDGKCVIAITAEDKAVRVFSISQRGRLRQTSSRSMPKKCCAITLTADERTILTADKFGDVYGIPLHPTPDYQHKTETSQPTDTYKVSATELTVHTKGNLASLKQQQIQQQTQKQKHPKKEGPSFEHKLLLGHVSLLTDLKVASGVVNGKARPFVLTSDRDEHIRVSRGIPQTHVIHSFCLGHSEFVSKLCVLPWDRKVLVAGNGEPSLRVYDWQEGKQRSRLDLIEQLGDDIEGILPPTRTLEKLAVSGIWPVALQSSENALLVALEGLPLLFSFDISDFDLVHTQTFKLDGNVLDIVQCPAQDILAISIDTTHKGGSYKEYRSEMEQDTPGIQFVSMKCAEIIANEATVQSLYLEHTESMAPWNVEKPPHNSTAEKPNKAEVDVKSKTWEKEYSTIGEFIYGLENLRKRRGKAGDEEDDEEALGDDVEPEGIPEEAS